jgi:hypothetical protein
MAYGVELNVFKISIGGTPPRVKHFSNAFSYDGRAKCYYVRFRMARNA